MMNLNVENVIKFWSGGSFLFAPIVNITTNKNENKTININR
jgi:hypothetical protein